MMSPTSSITLKTDMVDKTRLEEASVNPATTHTVGDDFENESVDILPIDGMQTTGAVLDMFA